MIMVKPRVDQAVRSLGSQRPSLKKLAAMDAGKIPTPSKKGIVRGKSAIPTQQPKTTPKPRSEKKVPTAQTMYVLDTNVLMHDPLCVYRFEEHHVYFPMQTVQELDNNKTGHEEKNRNSRQVSRILKDILSSNITVNIHDGIPLSVTSGGIATGSLFLQTEDVPAENTAKKADDKILAVVTYLTSKYQGKFRVVLVTKDTNMHIKARMSGLNAQDYLNDMVIEDTDILYQGIQVLPDDFWDTQSKNLVAAKEGRNSIYVVSGPFVQTLHNNEFVYSNNGTEFDARVTKKDSHGVTLCTVNDHTHLKNALWGITARNREQNFAINLLLDPDIHFLTLLGQAGTGKTLLTLAAGLVQVLETKLYTDIIITRVTVPIGAEIGFLPGTEEEKMTPWMGALEDNLDVLNMDNTVSEKGEKAYGGDWGRAATMDIMRSRIKIKSLNFMRGRTFLNKFLIIDEAQNLTPKQMKTLITRAGPGTKVVCLGNLAQIDTPYLTEGSSGLTYVVDRFRGWKHGGHVTLLRGERSPLADHASKVL